MTEQELKELATKFVTVKREADKFKTEADKLNSEIKKNMKSRESNEIELDNGFKVIYSVSTTTNVDEEKMLLQLKKYAPDTECIKTMEYIDTDILEKEIYNERLSEQAMKALEKCQTVKEIPKLTIKKIKEDK